MGTLPRLVHLGTRHGMLRCASAHIGRPRDRLALPAKLERHPPTRSSTFAAALSSPEGWKPYDASMRRAALPPDSGAFTVVSWNVAGLRALLRKDPHAMRRLILEHRPAVICLQETKLQNQHVEGIEAALELEELGYCAAWSCAAPPSRLGYSGVAMLVRSELCSGGACIVAARVHEDVDCEGRALVAEFPDLYVVCTYVPNAGADLKRLDYRVDVWDVQFSRLLKDMNTRKPVILAGDLNVAHQDIDIHSPSTNQRSAGFTQEERTSFASRLLGQGFVDVFRQEYPDVIAYTYWSYRANSRARNKGWRLDYTLVRAVPMNV
eukprot:jgi/Tetstr1/462850/TSEL_007799.t1